MASLKEPQKGIPGGFKFVEPSTRWSPNPFSSLDSITQQLIAHRKGRPDLIAKNNWSLDPAVVIEEVKQYNVALCQAAGWLDYIQGSAEAVPFLRPTSRGPLQAARLVAGGAETLVDWISSGAEAVASELANARAATCVKCPMNKQGRYESFFTVPVATALLAMLETRKDMKLSTPHDDKLFVCDACLCPLQLKVHLPLDRILAKMKPEVQAALHESCWIRKRDTP